LAVLCGGVELHFQRYSCNDTELPQEPEMEMKLNTQLIKKWREEKCWSQEHLASVAGLSLRTIQRIEREGNASTESRMALASAFNVDSSQINLPEMERIQNGNRSLKPITGDPNPENIRKQQLVQKLTKDTVQRAYVETVAAFLVIVTFGYFLQEIQVGSANYYGCLLIMIGAGFIVGVIWTFTLSYRLLRPHPVSDSVFWHEAFMIQARLLRLVPLWYAAPICCGMLLMVVPSTQGEFPLFLGWAVVVSVLFALVTWLNRYAAAKIEVNAQIIAA
jgi:transcriptional regulator with XRE-family HTH domain